MKPTIINLFKTNKNKKINFTLQCEMGINEKLTNEKGVVEVQVKKKRKSFSPQQLRLI